MDTHGKAHYVGPLLETYRSAAVCTHPLAIVLERARAHPPDAHAFVDAGSGRSIRFGEVRGRVAAAAAGLASLGVLARDVVLVFIPPFLEFPLLVLGVISLGATVTVMCPPRTTDELVERLRLSTARVLLTTAELAAVAEAAAAQVEGCKCVAAVLRTPEAAWLEDAVDDSADVPVSIPAGNEYDPDRPLALVATSGTTGSAKLVCLTSRNMLSSPFLFPPPSAGPPLRSLIALAPHGISGFNNCFAPLVTGTTLLMLATFTPQSLLDAIETHRPNLVIIMPFQAWIIARAPHSVDLSSLKGVGIGGGRVDAVLLQALRARLPGISTGQGFGMTEMAQVCSDFMYPNIPDDACGKPPACCEAKVIGPDDATVDVGVNGELCLRGPALAPCYFNVPGGGMRDASGWFHTGDVASLDADGFLRIAERLCEIFTCGGVPVVPSAIEMGLLSHPDVFDAVVIRRPHADLGFEPVACVQLHDGAAASNDDLIEFAARLTPGQPRLADVLLGPVPRRDTAKQPRRALEARLAASLQAGTE